MLIRPANSAVLSERSFSISRSTHVDEPVDENRAEIASEKMSPFSEKEISRAGRDAYLPGMKGCPPLTAKQYRVALRHLRGRHRWRDRALLVLGVRTGLRISELLSLRVGQVSSGASILPRLYLERKDSKGKRTGASIVVHREAAAALAKWIQTRGPVQAEDWLFPSQRCPNMPMVRHTGWYILHHAFIAAGVAGMAGSQVCRKSFSANVYRALKGDLFRLSKALRHTSPLTTLAYLSFRQEEIDEAILKA
jgi:integrase